MVMSLSLYVSLAQSLQSVKSVAKKSGAFI